jgi:DNA repair exonuclease SbcCD ATPase subunit
MGQIQSAVNQAIGSTGQIVAFGLGPKASEAKRSEAEIKEKQKKLTEAKEKYKKLEGEIGKFGQFDKREVKEPLFRKRIDAAAALFDLDETKENAELLTRAKIEHENLVKRIEKDLKTERASNKELRKKQKQAEKALAKANAEIETKNNQIAEMYENAGITQPGGSN